MDGWKTIFLLGRPIFRGKLAISSLFFFPRRQQSVVSSTVGSSQKRVVAAVFSVFFGENLGGEVLVKGVLGVDKIYIYICIII